MEYKVLNFDFIEENLELLMEDELTINGFLEDTFSCPRPDEFEDPMEVIGAWLLHNYSDEGGAPDIADLEIVDLEYDKVIQKGKITFDYTVCYSYTCSDMDRRIETYDVVPFEISQELGEILLSIPIKPVRDTVEEF